MYLVRTGTPPSEVEGQLNAMLQLPGGYESIAAAERSRIEAEVATEREREAANSPEARRAAARAAAEAVEARKQDAANARLLLVAEGQLSESDAASATDDEALHAARIDVNPAWLSPQQRDAAARHLLDSGKWRSMTALEKSQASRDLSDGNQGFVLAMDAEAGVVASDAGSEGGDSE
jgi:hypothetical protein